MTTQAYLFGLGLFGNKEMGFVRKTLQMFPLFLGAVLLMQIYVPKACALDSVSAAAQPAVNASAYLKNKDTPVATFRIAAGGKGDTIEQSSKIGTGAQNFIESMAQRGLEFLANPDLSGDVKKESFKKLLQDSFDMKTIGRFSMGRYWRVSTERQKEEYQRLFEEMVVDVYSSRFSEYKGQRFETRGFRVEGEKDTIVHSFLIPQDGAEVQIDWRVRYKDGRYRIIDVIVEGVSMSVTQRSDFSSVIQRGGGNVDVLIEHLRQK